MPLAPLFAAAKGAAKSFFSGSGHTKGMQWLAEGFGVAKKQSLLSRGLGLGVTGAVIGGGLYSDGLWGGIKAAGMEVGINYGLGRAVAAGASLGTLGLGIAGGAAVAGGIGLGILGSVTGQNPFQVLARPYIREHMRKHAKLEMGAPVYDQFGTVSTMRQRSIQAMQRSKINGRSAMGAEASMMYRPYFR